MSSLEEIITHSTPENDQGKIEYKSQLLNIKPSRFEKLLTQMKYRLAEGHGECIYEIGITDSGTPRGLIKDEYDETMNNIRKLASQLICETTVLSSKTIQRETVDHFLAEVLIREVSEGSCVDLRIAVSGNVDAGKSTLVSVLTNGDLDNGRGSARQKVFNHRHELDSGRTSSVSHQYIGFLDIAGESFNNCKGKRQVKSTKTVSLTDLAGHEKYFRTTMYGLSSAMPDYCILVISANNGIQKMTREHLGVCLALRIPFFIVITRIDATPDNVYQSTLSDIKILLKRNGIRKIPYHIKNEDDMIIAAKNLKDGTVGPIFSVSNVTGHNINLLRKFLNILPIRSNWDNLANEPIELSIDSIYNVPGVGCIVAGLLRKGTIITGQTIWLGPDSLGHFKKILIKNIQINHNNFKQVVAGKIAAFNITRLKGFKVRYAMALTATPKATWEFKVDIKILFHSTTIKVKYQPMVHIHSVKQAASIIEIEGKDVLRTGDKAIVKMKFRYRPEFLTEGSRLVAREGGTRLVGTIIDLY